MKAHWKVNWYFHQKSARQVLQQAGVLIFAGGMVNAFLANDGRLISSAVLAIFGIVLIISALIRSRRLKCTTS